MTIMKSIFLALVVASAANAAQLRSELPAYAQQRDLSTCLECAQNCATCSGLTDNGDGTQTATIDLGACKGGDTMSWMCCRSAGCSRTSCNGEEDSESNKCDEVTWSSYTLDGTATSISIQHHDGKTAGDVACTSSTCCGGAGSSCASISGVCNQQIDLSTCAAGGGDGGGGGTGTGTSGDPEPEPECTADSDCSSSSACGVGQCNAGVCGEAPAAANTVCRASAGPCDVEETCDGTALYCPSESFHGSDVECRASAGACDEAEHCSGDSASCPTDSYKDSNHVCNPSAGVCDLEETCTGSSVDCPADVFKPSTHVCRAADIAADGTTCDATEFCTGSAAACPADAFEPAGHTCRPAADLCDVDEVCSGTESACPGFDQRKDHGYSFKCATTCFLCGVQPDELTHQGSTSLGGCGLGRCKNVVQLEWPACEQQCVASLCPNNRGLSNAVFQECQLGDGSWSCTDKFEGGQVANGICPLPYQG